MTLCLFCQSDPCRCDGRQGAVEASEVPDESLIHHDREEWTPPHDWHSGKTRSTGEAMALLEQTRRMLIDQGREIAREQIRERGSTHSRAVRDVMAARDLLRDDLTEFWLGAVFNTSEFVWTGERFTYHDPARNIHERTVKIWRLRVMDHEMV